MQMTVIHLYNLTQIVRRQKEENYMSLKYGDPFHKMPFCQAPEAIHFIIKHTISTNFIQFGSLHFHFWRHRVI